MRFIQLPALAIAASLVLGAVATAQTAAPPAPDHHALRLHQHGEAHIKAFHDALNIRPDQEAPFAAVVAAMHPARDGVGEPMHADHDKMAADHAALGAMTTPDRLDAMARMMDEHVARMREHLQRVTSAVKALYAVLSPDQRHTFDALSLMMGHEHMMGGMGREHGKEQGAGEGEHRDE